MTDFRKILTLLLLAAPTTQSARAAAGFPFDWIAFGNTLSVAGGTMTGPVNWSANNLSNTGDISVAPSKVLLLGNAARQPIPVA